jgi:DNA polymerase III subunit gamma/tau
VKDGSEPRLQLEMALLKATQPQADLSLQALMFRIDQLEAALGKADAGTAPATEPAPAPRPAPKAAASAAAPAAAVAPQVESSPQPVGSVELDQIVSLWPAVAEAVAEENGMLSAALSAATPTALEADRLTVAFPADAAFVKKKAEQGRDLVANAVRGITGQPLVLAFELSDVAPAAGPATLDHDQLIERLRAEFAAEEVFEDIDEEND